MSASSNPLPRVPTFRPIGRISADGRTKRDSRRLPRMARKCHRSILEERISGFPGLPLFSSDSACQKFEPHTTCYAPIRTIPERSNSFGRERSSSLSKKKRSLSRNAMEPNLPNSPHEPSKRGFRFLVKPLGRRVSARTGSAARSSSPTGRSCSESTEPPNSRSTPKSSPGRKRRFFSSLRSRSTNDPLRPKISNLKRF